MIQLSVKHTNPTVSISEKYICNNNYSIGMKMSDNQIAFMQNHAPEWYERFSESNFNDPELREIDDNEDRRLDFKDPDYCILGEVFGFGKINYCLCEICVDCGYDFTDAMRDNDESRFLKNLNKFAKHYNEVHCD